MKRESSWTYEELLEIDLAVSQRLKRAQECMEHSEYFREVAARCTAILEEIQYGGTTVNS